MFSQFILKNISRSILRCLMASALFLSLSIPLHAAPEAILRLDPGGHTALIRKLIITPNGMLVTASDDKTIRVWNPSTGREERKILGQLGPGYGEIYAIALSPDGKLLVSGGYLGPGSNRDLASSIRLHDFQSGELLQILKGHENVVQDLVFSPDGRWLASSSQDNTVRLWNRSGSRFTAGPVLRDHERQVYAVRLFEEGGRLRVVSASNDKTVRLWDTESGRQLALGRHEDRVKYLAVGRDWIASAGYDKTIRIWDYSLRPLRTIHSETKPAGLAAHPDGNRLLVGRASYPNKVNIWNVYTGRLLTSYTGHKNLTRAVGWLPDGTAVSAGGNDKEIDFWDADTGREQRRIVGGGRMVWASGLKGSQLGFGNTIDYVSRSERGPLEHAFDFRSLQVTKLSKSDASSFQRLRTHFGPLKLSHEKGGDYGYDDAVLVIKEGSRERARVVRKSYDGYRHRVYGFTKNGNIVSGGSSGFLHIYNKDGEELAKLVGHVGEVWALAIEGDRLLSGSGDQTLKLWDLSQVGTKKTLEPTVSLFVSFDKGSNPPEPSEWVAWTKSGYYASSLNGDRLIGFHINRGYDKAADFYDSTRFYEKLYRPDIVKLAFQLGSEEAAIAEASKKRRTEKVEVATILPPKVRILSPSDGSTVKEVSVTLEATATPPSGGRVEEVIVKINGRPLDTGQRGISRRKDIKPDAAGVVRILREVPLAPGENYIEVLAKGEDSLSNPATVRVTREEVKVEDSLLPDLYVLSVGVSDYEAEGLDLNYADNDARSIAEAFTSQRGGLFREVHQKVLTDSKATRGDVLDGFDWVERGVTQHDLAVVFLAGHGVNDDRGDYWFLPHDADPDRLRRSAVNWRDLTALLENMPGKTLLLVDTCKAGNATGTRRYRAMSNRSVTDALKQLRQAEAGVVVMSSSTGKELSQEADEWGHGAFTKAILEGLNGPADMNRDNAITFKELDLYVSREVKKLTNGRQHPTTQVPRHMPDFPVFLR